MRTLLASVAVPVFNERDNLEPVYRDLRKSFDQRGWGPAEAEMLFVDDGGTDGSAEVLRRLASDDPCVKVLTHPTNRGLGAAVRTALKVARGRLFTFVPGDGEVPSEEILRLLELTQGAAMVIGERKATEETLKIVRPLHRRFLTLVNVTLLWLSLRVKFSGREGAYVVKTDEACRIPLYSETGLANLELMAHYMRNRLPIAYGTVDLRPRLSGVSKVVTSRALVKQLKESFRLVALSFRPGARDLAKAGQQFEPA